MTLQQLKYIVAIVEHGSLSEAAKRLFVSQPSLSAAVKEIEGEIGTEIFVRTSRGIALSSDGIEFLSYARQILQQTELLEQRYMGKKPSRQLCSLSTQHYAFAVNAFVNLIRRLDTDAYEFTLRETRTFEIIEDVRTLRSEIGILYLNEFNKKVLNKLLNESDLHFHPLFEAEAHIFVSSKHPLAKKKQVALEELEPYPCLTFEQGENNSFYFSEEILSTLSHKKAIRVSDRATLFNLLIGLNGFTISSGVVSSDLNGENIIPVPLDTDERMLIGWISSRKAKLSGFASQYIQELRRVLAEHGAALID